MHFANPHLEAQWADYLRRVQLALGRLDQSEIEEILGDLEAHLEQEAEQSGGALGETELLAIQQRLGSPEEIAAGYDAADSQASEPQQPTALGITLALTSLALLLPLVVVPLLAWVCIPASAVLARVSLDGPGMKTSPYRWAAYPGLLLAVVLIVLIVCFWPLIPVIPLAAEGGIIAQIATENMSALSPGSTDYWLTAWSAALLVCGLWWIAIAWFVIGRAKAPPRWLYALSPFLPSFSKRFFLIGGLCQLLLATLTLLLL